MSDSIVIEASAYAKLVLHAARWPHCSVNGIFIGRRVQSKLVVTDVLPLFHTCLTLVPMYDVALNLVEAYCQTLKNVTVVGSYYVDATLEASGEEREKQPPFVATRLADRIAENCGESVLAILRNSELTAPPFEHSALQLFTLADGKWRIASTSGDDAVSDVALQGAADCVQNKLYFRIVDFDTHFDDASADFRNWFVNERLAKTAILSN